MSIRKFAFAIALVAIGLPTAYAAGDVPVETDTPAPQAVMSQECVKPMARHDHGAERLAPTPMSAKCAAPAQASAVKTKAKTGHDHARFHKLM